MRPGPSPADRRERALLRQLARRAGDPVARGLASWLVDHAATRAASDRIAQAFERTGPDAFHAFADPTGLRFVRYGLEPTTVEFQAATGRISVIPRVDFVAGTRVAVTDAIADHGSAMLQALRRQRLDAWARGCLLELFALPPAPWPYTPN